MSSSRFHLLFAFLSLSVFASVCVWQQPGILGGRLTRAEIDAFLTTIDRQISMPEEDRKSTLARVRAWAEADDGAPVLMLNLMRYHEELQRFPGAPSFEGTPEQSNDHYEDSVMPMLLGVGGYPVVGGPVMGPNVIGDGDAVDRWSRVLVVRYPSRRAFLELLADPAYAPIEPYKFMALRVFLVPVAEQTAIPDPRLLVGGSLLVLYLALGWAGAARKARRSDHRIGFTP